MTSEYVRPTLPIGALYGPDGRVSGSAGPLFRPNQDRVCLIISPWSDGFQVEALVAGLSIPDEAEPVRWSRGELEIARLENADNRGTVGFVWIDNLSSYPTEVIPVYRYPYRDHNEIVSELEAYNDNVSELLANVYPGLYDPSLVSRRADRIPNVVAGEEQRRDFPVHLLSDRVGDRSFMAFGVCRFLGLY